MAALLEANLRDLKDLERDLALVRAKALPFAIRKGLNDSATASQGEWRRQTGFRMILRNTWTRRTLLTQKAFFKGGNVENMESRVGSTQKYMLIQEIGGAEAKKGKHGVPIPTSVASGEGRGARPRRKPVRPASRIGRIRTHAGRGGRSRVQRNFMAIKAAKAAGGRGSKFAFLELRGNRKGIFRISGGKKRTELDLIWDLSKPSIRIPRNPTLQPTLTKLQRIYPVLQKRAALAELRRQQIRVKG